MLLRTLWLSLDPYMRGRMSDAPSYAKPVGIGDVMEGGAVSEVLASTLPGYSKGDIVVGRTGWQTFALSDGNGLQKVDPKTAPTQTALGVLGMPGMTAYCGLLEIGKPTAGGPWLSRRLQGPSDQLLVKLPGSRGHARWV
jgi:NADPH-dependent curcumin reductase CurA